MSAYHFLSIGFRPFFIIGALSMAVSIISWIQIYILGLSLPTTFLPRDWHVHTMLFGGVMAIIAGFTLTAVANWTGRPPVAGRELLILVVLWTVGRVAVSCSETIGPNAAMMVDLLFPFALVAVLAREIVAAHNHRNLKVVAVIAALGFTNLAFHMEAELTGTADYATRGAISLVLILVMLIGGRVIPAFTRNWLVNRNAVKLPAAFSSIDTVATVSSLVALATWTTIPTEPATALPLLVAGALNAARLSRWCGLATSPEPLLAILHVAFATVPIGFVVVGLSILLPDSVDQSAAVHVWTVGTMGTITLAMMARASRGHSGRSLSAGPVEFGMFTLVLIGTAARVGAPYAEGWIAQVLEVSGLAWVAAYLLFLAGYSRMLLLHPKQ